MNALRYQLDFLCMLILHPFASHREIFLKSDDANRPNQPTSQKPVKMDNFYKNCPIWLKFGMQVSYCPCPPLPAPAHYYRSCPLLPPLPTHSVADPNTFQIFTNQLPNETISDNSITSHTVEVSGF